MFTSNTNKTAKLHYMPNNIRMLSPGDHVMCAVTGEKILLDDLRYWSVERQEPYATADIAVQRELAQ